MKVIMLNFCFKGNRNYIQGADIYNAIFQQVNRSFPDKQIGALQLEIHNFTLNNCIMLLPKLGENIPKPEQIIAGFSINIINEGVVSGWLIENNDPVACRYEYDESRIESLCIINDKKITVTGDAGYSPMEVVVSMTKQLHNNLFPSNDLRWIISKIDLKRPLVTEDKLNLCIEQQFIFNNRFTKSEIISGKESIGQIFFSLVKL